MTEVSELVRFQRELKEEEQLIVTMLSKIDSQLHALKVEQLHLLNATNSQKQTLPVSQRPLPEDPTSTESNVKKELDLEVPTRMTWQESEDEEEDDSS